MSLTQKVVLLTHLHAEYLLGKAKDRKGRQSCKPGDRNTWGARAVERKTRFVLMEQKCNYSPEEEDLGNVPLLCSLVPACMSPPKQMN